MKHIMAVVACCIVMFGSVGMAKAQTESITLQRLLFKREGDTLLQKVLAPYTAVENGSGQNEKRITYKDKKGKYVLAIYYRYSPRDKQFYAATITAFYNTNKKSIYGVYTGALADSLNWGQNWSDIKKRSDIYDIEEYTGGVKFRNENFNWFNLGFEKIDEQFGERRTYTYYLLNKFTVSATFNMNE